jgi:hypothetical protein
MSGSSGMNPCQNCGAEGSDYYDWKPFTTYSFDCVNCGYMIYSSDGYMSLDNLNRMREQHNENMDLTEDDEGYLHPLTQEEYDAIERKSPYLGAIDTTLLREE